MRLGLHGEHQNTNSIPILLVYSLVYISSKYRLVKSAVLKRSVFAESLSHFSNGEILTLTLLLYTGAVTLPMLTSECKYP